jgi:hypothetical protein
MTDKIHILDIGETLISVGLDVKTKTPCIKLEQMKKAKTIGENLLGKEISVAPSTTIIIKNLEGLAVLEKAIKIVKKQLKKQNKKLK